MAGAPAAGVREGDAIKHLIRFAVGLAVYSFPTLVIWTFICSNPLAMVVAAYTIVGVMPLAYAVGGLLLKGTTWRGMKF